MGAVSGATLNEIQPTYFQTFKFKHIFSFYLNPPNVETWREKLWSVWCFAYGG